MSVFTSISSRLWLWEPFRRLPRSHDDEIGRHAQLFWLALYTMPEAKLHVPGMIMGSVTALAEGCGFQPDLARSCLDRLIEAELVEYDVERRLLRMTQLPDAGEYPRNDKVILSWWRRFQAVPPCPLRDAHVATLKWLLEEHIRETGKAPTDKVRDAWAQTFGTISMPATRRRGVRRMQQSLPFLDAPIDPETGSVGLVVEQPLPVPAVDNSAETEIKNQVVSSTRVEQEIGTGTGTGISGSGSGGGSGEGHDPGNASSSRPHLALVPAPSTGPYTAAELLQHLATRAAGRVTARMHDESLWPALERTAAQLHEHRVSLDDLALLARWLSRGMAVDGDGKRILGPPWVARPNAVLNALRAAQAEESELLRKQRELAEVLSLAPANLHLTTN